MKKRQSLLGFIRALGVLPVAVLWLSLAAPAPAVAAPLACTQTTNLGALGPPASRTFGHSFNSSALFSDCWEFSIAAPATATGSTTEIDASFWFLPRYVDVLTVALYNPTTFLAIDASPSAFTFSGLTAGNYGIAIGGYSSIGFGTASYSATLTTAPARTTSVPEPSTLAMLGLALVGLALSRSRLQKR